MKTKNKLDAPKEEAQKMKNKPEALTDDMLAEVTGGFNLFYVCDQWAMRPGPFPFNEDCRFCFYCVHRNAVGCELGRQ